MGFGVIIDIMGSIIIGGIILMMVGDINSNIVENNFDRNLDLRSSFNLTSTTKALEEELRNIGYSADYLSKPRTDSLILLADTSKIRFLYDYDMNKVLDTIYYYVGSVNELNNTPNPNDRYLYKRINSRTAERIASGITRFRFEYYTIDGTSLSTPVTASNRENIASFQVTVYIGSPEKRMEKYTTNPYPEDVWRLTRVTARNLRQR